MLSRFDIFKMQFSSRRPSKCHGMTLLFNYAVKAAAATMFVGNDAQNQCVRGVRTPFSDAFSIVLAEKDPFVVVQEQICINFKTENTNSKMINLNAAKGKYLKQNSPTRVGNGRRKEALLHGKRRRAKFTIE